MTVSLRGTLRKQLFQTVKAQLRTADLTSDSMSAEVTQMSYWIFQCDPARFRLDARLREPMPNTTWLVNRYQDEIGPGHAAFLWVSGPDGGLRATMSIESSPRVMLELEHERPFWTSIEDTGAKLRVLGTITRRGIRLTREDMKRCPELESLGFLALSIGTNFRVSPLEASAIFQLISQNTSGLRL